MKLDERVPLRTLRSLGIVLAAVALVAGACSGGGDDDEAGVLIGEVVESDAAESSENNAGGSASTGSTPSVLEIGTSYTLTVEPEQVVSTVTLPAGSITTFSLDGADSNLADVQLTSSDWAISVSTASESSEVITANGEPLDLTLTLAGNPGDRATLLITSEPQPDANGEGDAPAIITDAPLLGEGQSGVLGGFDDTDVFAIDVASGDVLSATLSADATNASGVNVALSYNGESRGRVSANAGGVEELNLVTATGEEGTWYLTVTGQGRYQLDANVVPHPDGGGGRGDAGDDLAGALSVEPGTIPGLFGDADQSDFYTFDLAEAAVLNVTIRSDATSSGTVNLRVMLNGDELSRIAASPGGSETMVLSLSNEEAQTAVLELWGSDATYEIDLVQSQQNDGGVIGDAGEDASALVLDEAGEINASLSRFDGEDHFIVPVEAGPLPVTVSFATDADGGAISVRILFDGSELGRVSVSPGGTESFEGLEIDEAGEIRIETWNSRGNYTIRVGEASE